MLCFKGVHSSGFLENSIFKIVPRQLYSKTLHFSVVNFFAIGYLDNFWTFSVICSLDNSFEG